MDELREMHKWLSERLLCPRHGHPLLLDGLRMAYREALAEVERRIANASARCVRLKTECHHRDDFARYACDKSDVACAVRNSIVERVSKSAGWGHE
jgi:hypothetical protein